MLLQCCNVELNKFLLVKDLSPDFPGIVIGFKQIDLYPQRNAINLKFLVKIESDSLNSFMTEADII